MPRSLSQMSTRSSGDFSASQTQTEVSLHSHSHSRSLNLRTGTGSGHASASSSTGSLCLPNSSSDLTAAVVQLTDEPAAYQGPTYTVLTPTEIHDTLVDLAHPYTALFSLEEGIKADGISFQPCLISRSQDRYVVEQLGIPIPGSGNESKGCEIWTLTGVFDGRFYVE